MYLLTVRFAYALSLFVVLAACIPQEAPPDTQSNSTEVPADAGPTFLVILMIAGLINQIRACGDLADNPQGLRDKNIIELSLGAVAGYASWLILSTLDK